MVFLIMALSLGVYNSTAARTINENAKDRVRYETGADIVIKPFWQGETRRRIGPLFTGEETNEAANDSPRGAEWSEPPFELYAGLDGVETATRVLKIANARIGAGERGIPAVLMAITPGEFGRVAWMRADLLPAHWYLYLNLLGRAENVVLLSSSIRDELGVRRGDVVTFSWKGGPRLSGIVYAFLDYWPTFNPYSRTTGNGRPALIVANYGYVQNASVMQPYEIWIKSRDRVDSNVILQDAVEKDLPMISVDDTSRRIIETANDPVIQSTNGVLTLGFLVSMGITFAGFVIYWVLTLKRREPEFGVLRAMGLRKRQVTLMLVAEQVLITGTSVLLGALIGRAASILYVPFLQTVYDSAEQVVPFRVVELPEDFLRIYAVCGAMIVLVSIIFRILVSRLKVHETLKLSEG